MRIANCLACYSPTLSGVFSPVAGVGNECTEPKDQERSVSKYSERPAHDRICHRRPSGWDQKERARKARFSWPFQLSSLWRARAASLCICRRVANQLEKTALFPVFGLLLIKERKLVFLELLLPLLP